MYPHCWLANQHGGALVPIKWPESGVPWRAPVSYTTRQVSDMLPTMSTHRAYTYAHTHIHKYIRTHAHTHLHIYTNTYAHTPSHIHTQYICTHAHTPSHIHTQIHMHAHTPSHIHTQIHMLHAHTPSHIHTQIHLPTHTHIHTRVNMEVDLHFVMNNF